VTPYWQDEKRGLTIYHGDCRAILPTFADGEFGSVVTDPPYGIGFADWDIPPDSAILQQCLRVAEGSVVMFGGARPNSLLLFAGMEPSPDRMLTWMINGVWPMNTSQGMHWRWHPIWCWNLPKHAKNRLMRDIIECPAGTGNGKLGNHPSRKPEFVMERLLWAFGGRSTLDPYMGSGTTLVAAAKLGIPACGVEREEKYCRMAVCRLEGGFMADEPAHLFNQKEDAPA